MRNRILIINLLLVSLFNETRIEAQVTDPTTSVAKFGNYMSEWSKTGDDKYRFQLVDEVFPQKGKNNGAEKCLVNDGLMKIFADRDETGLIPKNGTSEVISYLKELTKAIDDDMKYKHEAPVWQKDYKEPVAYEDAVPIQFASMDFSTSGNVKYSGADLFFVQGNYIVKIVDFEDPLARAIRLYSKKEYKEAFQIFRELAYADPNNYFAQYYTVVMEIKKQGCGNLGNKVRDLEAAWWIHRGLMAHYFDKDSKDFEKFRIATLKSAFGVEAYSLPYYNSKREDFFAHMVMTVKLCSYGLMPFKKSAKDSRMGYMDESGKVVIPCKYETAFPFNSNGLALVRLNGKYGYVNRSGDMVIPAKYAKGAMQFKNGRTYVLENDALLLIDEKGNVVKNMGNGFDNLDYFIVGGHIFAHSKNTDMWHECDFNGEAVDISKSFYSTDYKYMHYYKEKNGVMTRIGRLSWEDN